MTPLRRQVWRKDLLVRAQQNIFDTNQYTARPSSFETDTSSNVRIDEHKLHESVLNATKYNHNAALNHERSE